MWGMTQGTKSTKDGRKPGQALLSWGVGVLMLGLLFVVMGLTSTEVDGNGIETTAGPTPLAWITLIAGAALIAWGFGKRTLSALEKD